MKFSELLEDLDSRMSSAKVTGFWSEDAKKEWLNQAGQRICDYTGWEWLKKAVYTSTRDGREYYDYPEASSQTSWDSLKMNSIYNIVIAGEEYYGDDGRIRKQWDDFQRAKLREDTTPIFSNHNQWYFLHPIPEDGKEMVLYGLKRWRTLSGNDDVPISPAEFNEPLVRLALATCLRKARRYDEAISEVQEIMGQQGGILFNLREQEREEGPRGYVGKIKHIRFNG